MKSAISVAKTLSPKFYICRQHFQAEIEKVFHKNWINIGRVNQVSTVGDYFAGNIGRQPYMVTRYMDRNMKNSNVA